MRIGQLAALAIGIGVLTGCATTAWGPFVESTPCKDPTCQVDVKVTSATNPRSCKIDVQPPKLDVSGGPSVQKIKWTVSGIPEPFRYLPTGILPIAFGSNARSVMSAPEILPDYQSVTVTYTRPETGGRTYVYQVNTVVAILENFLCSTDPWVVD